MRETLLSLRTVTKFLRTHAIPILKGCCGHYRAAVSVGMVGGEPLVDLTYQEDSAAVFDCNLVFSGSGGIVEVQGTAEGPPLARPALDTLLDWGLEAARELFRRQNEALATA